MITNTQRILYSYGYVPAYKEDVSKGIEFHNYYYTPKFEKVVTDGVWKIELNNCCVSYFSKCKVKVGDNKFTDISRLRVGDTILTFHPYFFAEYPSASLKNMDLIVDAYLGEKTAIEEMKKIYKIPSITKFKLLNNNLTFLSEFVSCLTRKLAKGGTVVFNSTYEVVQEIHLALSLFGVSSSMRKATEGVWKIGWEYEELADVMISSRCYKVKEEKILSIKYIPQITSSYKVTASSGQLVVNTVIIKGD